MGCAVEPQSSNARRDKAQAALIHRDQSADNLLTITNTVCGGCSPSDEPRDATQAVFRSD